MFGKNRFTMKKFLLIYLLAFPLLGFNQIAINTTGNAPDASAALDVDWAGKGLLIPRISLTSNTDGTTISSPATSLLVYNTNASMTGGQGVGYYYNAGTPASPNWVKFLVGKEAWMITGNDNTDPATNFLGTTNDKDLQFRTNNLNRMRIMSSSYSTYPTVGIGTTVPVINLDGNSAVLHVHDGGNSVGSQLVLSTHSTTAGARSGGLFFAATQATNNRITANIQSYLTAYSGGNASGDLRFFTNNNNSVAERMRLYETGQLVLSDNTTFPSATANFLFTIQPTTNNYRSGISIPMSGASSTAYAINVSTANANSRGYFYENTSGSNGVFYGAGSQLSTTNIASGYLSYRNSSGLTYGIYGINGTNAAYTTNANVWAAFIQGRAVISSESSPTSPLGVDLEIRNTTTGSGYPATLSMRQTTTETTSGRTLARLNFGDNHTTDPQAQISILRDAAGGSGDYPTAILFSTTPDGSSTLTERMRIVNNGNVGINTTTPSHRLHVYNNTNSISAIYADNSAISSSGTSWTYGSSNVSGVQGISTTGSDYTAGIFGYRFSAGSNGAGVIGAWSSITWGGLGCEEGSNRWGVFTPVNAAVRGYLLVGNPNPPQSIVSGASLPVFQWNNQLGLGGMVRSGGCGTGDWSYIINGLSSYYKFENVGSRSYKPLYTPWMWIPSNSNVKVELNFNNTLESGYDGVYLEYTTDNSTWTKLNTWDYHGYNLTIAGSNSSCSGNDSQLAWSSTGDYGPLSSSISITNGTWVRFRLVGVEDNSSSTGDFRLYGFSVWIENPSFGGSFTAGNIYAEKNVYAGSNVLLGDLAEYFKVDGNPQEGMLIVVNPNKKDGYIVSKNSYSEQLIGVYSENPTLTLNNPKSGIPVALAGRVPVLVTANNGPIKVGDYLTSSNIPGVAMKADKSCFVIGMALEPYNDTTKEGKILCLIQPGWYNHNVTFASGNFYIPDNNDEIIVHDERVTSKSKIFLTMLDDPNGWFWIKEKGNGKYTVKLSSKANGNIDFDYLIENAKSNKEENNTSNSNNIYASKTKPIDFENGQWKYDPVKDIYWREEPEEPGIRKIDIPLETNSQMPPLPENPSNVFVYYTDSSLLKTIYIKDDKSKTLLEMELKEKEKEKEKK